MDFAKEKLEHLRQRLLKLSTSNQLLNTNFAARGLNRFRIIDELPNNIYGSLSAEKVLRFDPLPNLDDIPSDEKTPKFLKALEGARLTDEQYQRKIEAIENEGADDLHQAVEDAESALRVRVRKSLGLRDRQNPKSADLKAHAESKGINPDYSLPEPDLHPAPSDHKWTDNKIQTLLLPDRLKRHERSIARKTTNILRETGINALYMAFGFLEWKEHDDADRRLRSPLLLLPIEYIEERKSAPRKIKATGEPLMVNETLHEKLMRDFRVPLPELPELEDEDRDHSIEDYWISVQKAIADQKKWSLKRWISFGIYTDQNMPIFKDLGRLIEGELSDVLLRILTGIDKGSSNQSQEDYDVDALEKEKNVPVLIEKADASQYSAVIDALDGKDMVIKGPPGTGKSQTITNIITTLLGEGKRVLFVAQKQAALDVVRNNLKKNGLDDYVLEAFSSRANKTQIYESIARRVEKAEPTGSDLYLGRLRQYQKVKASLNDYAKVMATEFGYSNKTIHEILWDIPSLSFSNPRQLEDIDIGDPQTISHSDLLSMVQDINYLAETLAPAEDDEADPMPMMGLAKSVIDDPFQLDELIQELIKLVSEINKHTSSKENFSSGNDILQKQDRCAEEEIIAMERLLTAHGADPEQLKVFFKSKMRDHLEEISSHLDDLNSHGQATGSLLSFDLHEVEQIKKFEFDYQADKRHLDWLKEIKELLDERQAYAMRQEELGSRFDTSNSIYSDEDYRSAAKALRLTTIFSFFSGEWHSARRLFGDVWGGGKKPSFIEQGKALTELYEISSGKQQTNNHHEEQYKLLENTLEEFKSDLIKQEKALKKREKKIQEVLSRENIDIEAAKSIIRELSKKEITDAFASLNFLDETVSQQLAENITSLSSYLEILKNSNTLEQRVEDSLEKLGVERGQLGKTESEKFIIDLVANQGSYRRLVDRRIKSGNRENTPAGRFYAAAITLGVDRKELGDTYKYSVRRVQQRVIWSEHKDTLNLSSGDELGKLRADLKRLDEQLRNDSRNEMEVDIWEASSLGATPVGRASGRVSEKTERGLVQHICDKPRSRVPLRQVFKRAGHTVSQLKPCFLMSPPTVSQILPLKELFDVLIIDEASQLKPEFAIAAIARAKQAVIVGDPHQLPPDNRFTGVQEEQDEDFKDESILDMAITALSPPRDLMWHYRSRHENLIKFSNQQFYHNLMIPVTADPFQKGRGITRHFVKDAIYQARTKGQSGGINEKERDAIIDDVVEFMETRRDESLGVVAMNKEQTELIQHEFEQIVEKNSRVQDYVDHWKSENEGVQEFFIKSLENVQGDERDVMIIGTTYGPNREGRVHQRFTITGTYGRRRLNVLITRAKHEVRLFTSLPIDKLADSDDEARSTFKKYLEFARSGRLPEGEVSGHPVDNAFQQWAIDQVNSLPGFSAEHEIGVRGYRIDIGVKHEDFGSWIMAVETDGATYHSSRAARDRDLLRQEILEGYGWVFHRIWSTDWFKNPVEVRERLKSALTDRVEQLKQELENKNAHRSLDEFVDDDTDSKSSAESIEQPMEVEDKAYPISDISDVIDPDANAFYWPNYRNKLTSAVNHVIETEGPIELDLLVRRIREGHGFAKAGDPIRAAISKAIPKTIKRSTYRDHTFLWPENADQKMWARARYPSSSTEDINKRKFNEVCPEEVAAIAAVTCKKETYLSPSERAKKVSQFLGWQKCSGKASDHLTGALEEAENSIVFAADS